MSKRTADLPRHARDFYATPREAVPSLAPLLYNMKFIEPCAGDGRLVGHIVNQFPQSMCVYASDIQPLPQHKSFPNQLDFNKHDVFTSDWKAIANATEAHCFITNPPFLNTMESGRQLFKLIDTLTAVRPTILLLPSDFAFNISSAPYIRLCTDIVPIGRLKWVAESKFSSVDNFCWYRFTNVHHIDHIGPIIHPRKKV